MKTALEKLEYAIQCERERHEWIDWFTFRSGDCVVDYMGRYYFYTYADGSRSSDSEDEYCCSDFDDLLATRVSRTGKTMRQMLLELPAHDLELHFDSCTPPSVPFTDD